MSIMFYFPSFSTKLIFNFFFIFFSLSLSSRFYFINKDDLAGHVLSEVDFGCQATDDASMETVDFSILLGQIQVMSIEGTGNDQ